MEANGRKLVCCAVGAAPLVCFQMLLRIRLLAAMHNVKFDIRPALTCTLSRVERSCLALALLSEPTSE